MARGRLRIYLGAAPGVGKTYAMLAEGQRRVEQGADCVIAFVEPHGRHATIAMTRGLEAVPRQRVPHREGDLWEMDVDAVLARSPQIALVDELAHTNAPGSRHRKRWEDVETLLEAGIDVLSTLNVQHLESLNDVVFEMTGVRQRETLPDAVARGADELELVDLSPEALRRRLVAGEVYPPDRIDAALSHYFRPGNLTALRELALLWLADRVDEGLRHYREEHGIAAPWEARERIVVGVSGGRESDPLIRRAARLSARIPGSELLAVHVARSDGRPGADPAALARYRTLVESLGGSWHQVVGMNVVDALGQFARHENATQLVVGASRPSRVWSLLSGREVVARRVTRLGAALDVHVVIDERHSGRARLALAQWGGISARRRLQAILATLVSLPLMTFVLTRLGSELALSSDLLFYLLAVVLIALIGGLFAGLLAALCAALLADYFFVAPLHSLAIATANGAVSLVVFVAAALLVSWAVELASRRQQVATRASAAAAAMGVLADAVLRSEGELPRLLELVRETFGLEAVSLLETVSERLPEEAWIVLASAGERAPERPEQATVEAAAGPSVLAGRGRRLAPADLQVFRACAAELADFMRDRQLAARARSAAGQADAEQRRMAVAAAAERRLSDAVERAQRALVSVRELGSAAGAEETARLDAVEDSIRRIRVVLQELADLARARGGALDVHLRPVDLAEVVATSLEDLGPGHHALEVRVPDDLAAVIADAALLTRAVTTLAANALRRSPPDARPVLAARASGASVEISISDSGPAMATPPPSGPAPSGVEGVEWPAYGALAVSVAHDLIEAIGGSLRTESPAEGGLTVTIRLAAAAWPGGRADGRSGRASPGPHGRAASARERSAIDDPRRGRG